jgi:alkyldihydroxyacetonephosphate synthase
MTLRQELVKALPALRVSDDLADRVTYARDLWPRHHLAVRAGNVARAMPGCVVWPESTADVARIVKHCAQEGIPVVPFGAGSGVCAGVLPEPRAVILDLKRMAKIRELDRRAPFVDVEAGFIGVPFEEEMNRQGFTLGHFPSSILCSTVGGWVAARSAGQCSGKYGKIEDMVVRLECVTGTGEIVTLHHRTPASHSSSGAPSLVPIVVGSEGTLAVVTSAALRLHPNPTARSYAGYTFRSTEDGWEAMRAAFQAGLRPAVARLYDPFDAMLARMGSVKKQEKGAGGTKTKKQRTLGEAVLRNVLGGPKILNGLIDGLGGRALGGALVVVIFEGEGDAPARDAEECTRIFERCGAKHEGEGPARKWMQHRYSVSYRQAPVFSAGMFSDTMEVAAPWSKLGALYDGVRHALGDHVFVMAHMSHAYPDGCCIYFSFAGTAGKGDTWDEACESVYDRAWKAALEAAARSGGTIAHHHGVGRSKAPAMRDELGHDGIEVVRALKRAFDPKGIMNPGTLLPPTSPEPYVEDARERKISS